MSPPPTMYHRSRRTHITQRHTHVNDENDKPNADVIKKKKTKLTIINRDGSNIPSNTKHTNSAN